MFPLGKDLVDVPVERIDDGGTGTMAAVGAAVEIVAPGVQTEAEVVTGTALLGTMTEISLDALVDLLEVEAGELEDVSLATMI